MPRKCSICQHSDADKINRALVGNGRSLRDIARQHNVSKDALWRHKERHLPSKLTKAKEAEEVAEASGLLSQILRYHERAERLYEEAIGVLRTAKSEEDHQLALSAIREARSVNGEARKTTELLAEVQGELQREGTVNVEIHDLQAVVLDALDGRPEAQSDVARALFEHDPGP